MRSGSEPERNPNIIENEQIAKTREMKCGWARALSPQSRRPVGLRRRVSLNMGVGLQPIQSLRKWSEAKMSRLPAYPVAVQLQKALAS
jgi:hypothetical protein